MDADTSIAAQRLLEFAGGDQVAIAAGPEQEFLQICAQTGPVLALLPSFAHSVTALRQRLGAARLVVSGRSALVLEGDVRFEGTVEVDGALVARAAPGATLILRDVCVKNAGWERTASEDADPSTAIRGYVLTRTATATVEAESGERVVTGAVQ